MKKTSSTVISVEEVYNEMRTSKYKKIQETTRVKSTIDKTKLKQALESLTKLFKDEHFFLNIKFENLKSTEVRVP